MYVGSVTSLNPAFNRTTLELKPPVAGSVTIEVVVF